MIKTTVRRIVCIIFNPFLADAAFTLHYTFLQDVTSMRSSLFTNFCYFHILYEQIGLSYYKTKSLDRDSLEIPVFSVKAHCKWRSSLQMATSSMTHLHYFHDFFHILLLINAADTKKRHSVLKSVT